jgi:hypothetical protein
MAFRLKIIFRILSFLVAVIYPFLIFYFLVIQKTDIKILSLFIIAFAIFAFITGTSKKKELLLTSYGLRCSCLA